MNQTTRLRETRNGQGETEDYPIDDFGVGRPSERDETLSEE
jgi:hypothetical protein